MRGSTVHLTDEKLHQEGYKSWRDDNSRSQEHHGEMRVDSNC